MYQRIAFLLAFMGIATVVTAQQPTPSPNQPVDSTNKSIPAIAKGNTGNTTITVEYHSPRVRRRMVWGGVVPLNEVWVSGAHMATKITFAQACRIGNKTIAAGTYAFFTIPGADSWTVILNRNFKQHLTDNYDANEDVLRLTITPLRNQPHLERLEYFIHPGKLVLGWERIRIEVPIESHQ